MPKYELISENPFDDVVESPWQQSFHCGGREVTIDWRTLRGGLSDGVRMLIVHTGAITAAILPTRGMGLWKVWAGELAVGWESPVRGPVHPSLVPVFDPSGIGWLEGFDELLVRCGLSSNGAPQFDASGRLRWPLHGRIANLPATELSVEIDESAGTVDVVGVVPETRVLVGNLQLESRYRFHAGSPRIEIEDTVSNVSAVDSSFQLLYHINIGEPLLEAGGTLLAAASELAPRDARAAEGVDGWYACSGPTSGYAEQVYFAKPIKGSDGRSVAAFIGPHRDRGLAVEFETSTLPYLTIWKNTAAREDGYVIGIEPATGLPNTREFEESAGRVVKLADGESQTMHLAIEPLIGVYRVTAASDRIAALQRTPLQLHSQPQPGWSTA